MGYEELMRRKLMEQIYDKMSEDEKRLFIQLTLQNKNQEEIMQALQGQRQQLADIKKGQNWAVDFGSDVAANLFTDGLIWVISKLVRKL